MNIIREDFIDQIESHFNQNCLKSTLQVNGSHKFSIKRILNFQKRKKKLPIYFPETFKC